MQKCMRCMGDVEQQEFCPRCGNEIGRETYNRGQLPEGTILNKRYIVGQEIGRDAIGITYIAWDAGKEERVAIKEWFPSQFGQRADNMLDAEFRLEKALSSSLQKQFLEHAQKQADKHLDMLVQVDSAFRQNGTVYYTMEYLDGITLRQVLQQENPLEPEEARIIFDKVVQASEQMHVHGIIHGNLNPDNVVLMQDGTIRFLNRAWRSPELEQIGYGIYQHSYAAPELYPGAPQGKQDADTYSMYAIYYRMLTGSEPADVGRRMEGEELPAPRQMGIYLEPEEERRLMEGLQLGAPAARKKPAAGAMKEKGKSLQRIILILAAAAVILAGLILGSILIGNSKKSEIQESRYEEEYIMHELL